MSDELTIGIVVSDTYPEITSKMFDYAKEKIEEAGLNIKFIRHVSGSFDIPYAVNKIVDSVDGVITLGAIIKGETKHDEIIGHAIANKLLDISCKSNTPVSLGISGPGMTRLQAEKRIEKVTKGAVNSILNSLRIEVKNEI